MSKSTLLLYVKIAVALVGWLAALLQYILDNPPPTLW